MSSTDLVPFGEGMSNTASLGLEYEVFLSFRGPDTRATFTDHLYVGLINAGIRVYRDDEELRIGEEISLGLLKGIKESKIAIPILSKDYASSKWCLKELAEIMKWKQSIGLKVMPIFYYVTPSEVRKQTGDYKKAFESYEKHYDEKTIQEWREALRQIGQLKGWEIQMDKNRQEGKLVDEVIKMVLRQLKKAYTVVTDCLVGVDHHVEAILNMVNIEANDVRIVVIHGMGGIGKTTLAKVIYNHLLPRYECHSFLADIRETSLTKGIDFLQKKMISDILKREETNIANIDEGIAIISERFMNKKVLILLDDVDENSHLKGLIGKRKWFGPGSRIIITTRNKGILDLPEVSWSYELGCMDSQPALQLFSKHAFRSDRPPVEYTLLSQKAVEMTGRLPLSLEVIGSLLCGKNKKAWDNTLKRLEKIPNREVSRKLKISFDSLDDRQKEIFLDIACFFVGVSMRIVIHFWNDDELFPEEAIEMLQQVSLIKIHKDDSIWMHDQLRDMGRDIVRQEHIEPEKRSRLWNLEETITFFGSEMGHENVRGICLHQLYRFHFPVEDFTLLPNLRFLHVRGGHWDDDLAGKVLDCLTDFLLSPSFISRTFFRKSSPIFSKMRWLSWHELHPTFKIRNVSLRNLVILDLTKSQIQTGWSGWRYVKMANKLRVLNLTGCDRLVKTPDLSFHPLLEQLILEGCSNLVKIDKSIGMLEHLVIINLKDCKRLQKLPERLSCTESLEQLIIDGTAILEIPDWPAMKRLTVFCATYCHSLNKVSSLNFATSLVKLSLKYCECVRTLPQSIGNLLSLEQLNLSHSGIIELPQSIGNLLSLEKLNLSESGIVELPQSIGNLALLQELNLSHSGIVELPQSVGNLVSLKELDLTHSGIVELPDTIGNLKNLIALNVGWTPIRELPATIGLMENLLKLGARECNQMVNLPKFPQSLISLKVSGVKLERIPDLSDLIHLRKLMLLLEEGSLDPFEAGSPAPWWIGRLNNLEKLVLGFPQAITLNADLAVLSQLKKLMIVSCYKLRSISKLPSSLTILRIGECSSLETVYLPPNLTELGIAYCCSLGPSIDLSHMRQLDSLLLRDSPISRLEGLRSCRSLQKLAILNCRFLDLDGLEILESLTNLIIHECGQLRMLPDLSNLNKLKEFEVRSCPNLVEIPGRLESLEGCLIYDCESLTRIPDIPNFDNESGFFQIRNCRNLCNE